MKSFALYTAVFLMGISQAAWAESDRGQTNLVHAQQQNRDVKIDPALVSFARGETAQKAAAIFIVMNNLGENMRLPKRYDYAQVVTYLRQAAAATKNKMDQYMAKAPNVTGNYRAHRFYFATLTYSAVVTPEGLRLVAQAPGVVKIYANRKLDRDPSSRPVEVRLNREAAYPYDLVDTGIDKLHTQFADITGKDIVLGSVDTGVDGKHPALDGKIKLFYDGGKKAIGEPHDTDTHGTHTIGTMVGSGQNGAPMGMAPGAKMIAASAMDGYDVMLESMDFMLDPDKNPNTADFPRAVNNSWHAGGAPDMELFYRAINSWEAAGILPVFSAGNAGPKDGSITRPKEHPAAFAVAATGENGKATNFSSRGPAIFNGQKIDKPDLAAPGNNIISSVPGGKYSTMSGTSMAAPHVTGASALLFQVDSKLTPVQVRAIFQKTTGPVDENGNPIASRGWNKVYGLGKMNAFEAVKLAKGVAARRMGLLEGFMGSFLGQYLSSPEMMDIADVLHLDADETVDPFSYPAGEEGTTWVSASTLF